MGTTATPTPGGTITLLVITAKEAVPQARAGKEDQNPSSPALAIFFKIVILRLL